MKRKAAAGLPHSKESTANSQQFGERRKGWPQQAAPFVFPTAGNICKPPKVPKRPCPTESKFWIAWLRSQRNLGGRHREPNSQRGQESPHFLCCNGSVAGVTPCGPRGSAPIRGTRRWKTAHCWKTGATRYEKTAAYSRGTSIDERRNIILAR